MPDFKLFGSEAPILPERPLGRAPRRGWHDPDTDPLTRLAVRGFLIERLGELLRLAASTTHQPGLILLDLNRFKATNDGLGPEVGDRLLRMVASRLRSIVPDASTLARISGDGFGVLLADGSKAEAAAARLLDHLGRPFALNGHAVTLGACFGFAIAGADGTDALSLFHAADIALHDAQRDARARIIRFHPSMRETAARKLSLESDFRASIALQKVELSRAMKSGQFEVRYQPQVSLADGRVTGFEALLRWHHPERGPVPPDRFIPIAEETGLIDLLGEWVLRTACREAAAWPTSGGRPLRIAVNVSPLQLGDGAALLNAIQGALSESGLPAQRLEIELTETAVANDVGETLAAISAMGVALALDDFGTGYSSLSRLHRHPFARLKIDRSFIADLRTGKNDDQQRSGEWMVRAIASLGLGLALDTVIEGVETPRQRDIARMAGCTDMQGYIVSRPVSGEEIPALLARLERSVKRRPRPVSERLHQLAYFSRNALAGDTTENEAEIERILAVARRRNHEKSITGALLFSSGCFAQVLEGPLASVEELFEKIQLDPRHRDVTILLSKPLARRNFGRWSMAYAGGGASSALPSSIRGLFDNPCEIQGAEPGRKFIAMLKGVIGKYEAHGI